MVQWRHLIPAPVNRTSVSDWLYKRSRIKRRKRLATHINDPRNCVSKLRLSVAYSRIHARLKLAAIECAVVYVIPGLPARLEQELNTGTVDMES